MRKLTWSDELTPIEKELYMAQLAILQLTDHVTSGAESTYCVYYDEGSCESTMDYQKALKDFNEVDESLNPRIALWCRIGTAVTIKSKGKAFE